MTGTAPVLALAGAFALDVTVGEPPQRVHPVAWFGRAVGLLDVDWSRPTLAGGCLAVGLPVLAALAVAAPVLVAARTDLRVAVGATAVGLFVSTSLRRLLERVGEVVRLSDDDPAGARDRLRTLAGRDASGLKPGQVRSAALESLAENLADGLVAPLLGFVGGVAAVTVAGASPATVLAAGAGGAAWVKAVNTLDSMLGYRDKPTGRAAARLDDAVMWLPARATAVLLAVATLSPGALRTAGTWTGDVPSPNSGWPMGTLAAAMDVRFEKPTVYVLNPTASLPDSGKARVAVRQVTVAGLLAYLLAGASVGVVVWF